MKHQQFEPPDTAVSTRFHLILSL